MRIKCIVQYDGSRFHGYQRQLNKRTVQQEIEEVITKIHKNKVEIHASGRTDAGVHALGQVFHFDSNLTIEPYNWKMALNSMLPNDIYIKEVEIVDEQFHARFSVKFKEYRYYLSLKEYNPIKGNYVYFHNRSINFEVLQRAIKQLEGSHDFTSFSSGKERENRERTIYEAMVNIKDDELEFIFRGNGFLRYQVRIMVGTLINIAEGKFGVNTINELFELKDRTKAGFTAAPAGLYLYKVEY